MSQIIIYPKRYENYTSRIDAYLFTLKAYADALIERFGGSYVNRCDMPTHAGYLLEFKTNYEKVQKFIEDISADTDDYNGNYPNLVKCFVLDPPAYDSDEGVAYGYQENMYATVASGINQIYIGLSKYDLVFDSDIERLKLVAVIYNSNDLSGAEITQLAKKGDEIVIEPCSFPGSFVIWNTESDGSGTEYAPSDKVTLQGDLILYAIWDQE